MTNTHCPKCGDEQIDASEDGYVKLFMCGTELAGSRVFESLHCLKKQLKSADARYDRMSRDFVSLHCRCQSVLRAWEDPAREGFSNEIESLNAEMNRLGGQAK